MRDDAVSEEKPPPQSGSPLLMGAIGLLLIVGGWKVSSWTPPREPGLIDEIRRMADADLRDKLDGYDRRERPMEWPGRLAFFVGLGLFGVATLRMWQAPAAVEEEAAAET